MTCSVEWLFSDGNTHITHRSTEYARLMRGGKERVGRRKRERERERAKHPAAQGLQCTDSRNTTDEEMGGGGMGALNLKCIKLIPSIPLWS